jgi:hypothetical protein
MAERIKLFLLKDTQIQEAENELNKIADMGFVLDHTVSKGSSILFVFKMLDIPSAVCSFKNAAPSAKQLGYIRWAFGNIITEEMTKEACSLLIEMHKEKGIDRPFNDTEMKALTPGIKEILKTKTNRDIDIPF